MFTHGIANSLAIWITRLIVRKKENNQISSHTDINNDVDESTSTYIGSDFIDYDGMGNFSRFPN